MDNYQKSVYEVMNMTVASGCNTRYIDTGEGNITGSYFAIMVLTDAVFSVLIDANNEIEAAENLVTNQFSGISIPPGIVLYGNFTSITLLSGLVCAYKVT